MGSRPFSPDPQVDVEAGDRPRLLVCALSWKGVEGAADGFKGGALVGLLLSLYFRFMNLGTMNTSPMNAATVVLKRGWNTWKGRSFQVFPWGDVPVVGGAKAPVLMLLYVGNRPPLMLIPH